VGSREIVRATFEGMAQAQQQSGEIIKLADDRNNAGKKIKRKDSITETGHQGRLPAWCN